MPIASSFYFLKTLGPTLVVSAHAFDQALSSEKKRKKFPYVPFICKGFLLCLLVPTSPPPEDGCYYHKLGLSAGWELRTDIKPVFLVDKSAMTVVGEDAIWVTGGILSAGIIILQV